MLRRQPERILIDSLETKTVIAVTGGVDIMNYGTILSDDVVNAYCECPSDCVAQETEVTVIIPDSCECPYEWGLTIVGKPCLGTYEVQTTFGKKSFYGYQDPSGATPTAAATATAIIANINADPFAIVTAASGGAGVIVLTEKDCSVTCGFSAYTESGTIVENTAHSDAVLDAEEMSRLFPTQWGSIGNMGSKSKCGTYCVWHFVLRSTTPDIQDIDMSSTYSTYEREVYFYVNNSNSADYITHWHTEMSAAFTAQSLACS